MDLSDIAGDLLAHVLGQDERPYRLHFAGQQGKPFQDTLVPQRLDITEGICADLTAHVTCLATRSDLPLKELLGQAVELQIVTDTGDLRRVCVIVTEVRQGQSDGSVTAVQFTGRDILCAMKGRRSNRVFLNKTVPQILSIVLDGWRQRNPALAFTFDYVTMLDTLRPETYPARQLTLQVNQDDADFLRGLCRRHGIAWFVRAGQVGRNGDPIQELVFFDNGIRLPENAAGPVKYHRRSGTEERDTISLLAPNWTLVSGGVSRASYDYKGARVHATADRAIIDQGQAGNAFAAALQDSRIEEPHAGDTWDDHRRLTRLDILRHEARAQSLHGIGGVRAQAVGEYNRIDGHPLLDKVLPKDREYVTVQLQHWAENSLPKTLNEHAQTLLAASASAIPDWVAGSKPPTHALGARGEHRYTNRFVAVPREAPIVPSWDPHVDLPAMSLMTAVVVGPEGEAVWIDELGRVKIRFLGLDPAEHEHAQGAGTNGNERDSAWVRVNTLWAGNGFGTIFALRAGMEVSVDFEQGDPSRPVITGTRYNGRNPPPYFDHLRSLPANKALSGIVTREFDGARQQQLRFNDSTGRISTQLASDHAAAQINLGHLTTPMNKGWTSPRGEGIEARTQAALAARGEQGLLLTTAKGDQQLDRDELLGLAQSLQAIVEQLGQLASTHRTSGTDPARFRQLVEHLRDWEKGSNTAPEEAGGGAPIIAMGSAAGTGIVSQDNLVLGARTHIDAVSAGHTQITAGQQLRQRAQAGVSVFAHTGGVEAIAGQGLVDIQAHQGNIHLTASDSIVLTAGVKVVIQAPEVQVISRGAQTQWGGGSVVEQASNAFVVKAANFAQTSGGDGVPAGVDMPRSDLQFDQQVMLRWLGTNEPMKDQRYRITTETGEAFEGRTDAAGMTQRFSVSLAYGHYTIEPLAD